MKKILYVAAAVVAMSFAACGGNTNASSEAEDNEVVEVIETCEAKCDSCTHECDSCAGACEKKCEGKCEGECEKKCEKAEGCCKKHCQE